MPSPEEIAAKIEQLAELEGYARVIIDADIPTLLEAAALLRAANPPINSESSPEPATPAVGACPTCRGWGIAGSERAAIEGSGHSDDAPCPDCSATPAVGEDAGADCECTCASELAEKVRALLADVARLQKELDGTTFREERYAEDAAGARLALEDARADVARLTEMLAAERKFSGDAAARSLASAKERDEARATLAAVRKIADDYHDVDVTGDPPREVACNPCANEILNVLERNHEPRR